MRLEQGYYTVHLVLTRSVFNLGTLPPAGAAPHTTAALKPRFSDPGGSSSHSHCVFYPHESHHKSKYGQGKAKALRLLQCRMLMKLGTLSSDEYTMQKRKKKKEEEIQ